MSLYFVCPRKQYKMIDVYVFLQTEFEDSLELLCGFVRRQLRRATMEKFEVEREASHPPVPVPYLFLTPKVRHFTILCAILMMFMAPLSFPLYSIQNDVMILSLFGCCVWLSQITWTLSLLLFHCLSFL